MTRGASRRSGEGRGAASLRRARRRALAAARRAEARLTAIWGTVERALARGLGGLARRPDDAAAIAARIRRAVEPTAAARIAAIRAGVRESAAAGLGAGAELPGAALGPLGEHAARAAARGVPPDRAVRIATTYLEGARAVGGLRLSARLHDRAEATVRAMAEELRETAVAGRTVATAAQRLLEVDDVRVELPRYVRDLRGAVLGGDRSRLRAVVSEHLAGAMELEDATLRASARRLARVAETATIGDLERQLGYWVRDRALYTERVVARTETARVFQGAFVESTREQPWVKGYRWELRGSHPRPDVCDVYANQAIDGLGPGGYLVEGVPDLPAHPNCGCFTTAILDEDHFERETAAARGVAPPPEAWRDPTHVSGADWLAGLPRERRVEILGPGRERVFSTHPERVVGARGRLAPLHVAEGRTLPPRAPRPSVFASSVDPFREAGSRRPGGRPPPAALPPIPAAPAGPPPAPPRRRPVAPAPPPPPAPPSDPRRELGAAIASDDRPAIRATARAHLESRGLTSRDVASPRRNESALRVREDWDSELRPTTDSRGSHSSTTGEISLARDVWAHLGSAGRRLEAGGVLTSPELQALRTLMHEETHGCSSLGLGVYRRHGRVLEETLVELHARAAVESFTGAAPGSVGGSYEWFIAPFRDAMRNAFGEDVDVDEFARRAALKIWRHPITSPDQYLGDFLDAVDPPVGRRGVLRSAIHAIRG